MSAPIFCSASSNPIRVGLTPKPVISISESWQINPATKTNAADEKSPGSPAPQQIMLFGFEYRPGQKKISRPDVSGS